MHACGDVSATLLYCTFWDSFKVKCPVSGTKTCIQYMNVAMFLLYWYRHVFLCFYYVASGTYCGSSEFKCALSVKIQTNALSCWKLKTHYTKPDPLPS